MIFSVIFLTLGLEGVIKLQEQEVLFWGFIVNLLTLSFGLSYNYSLLRKKTVQMEGEMRELLLERLKTEQELSKTLTITSMQREEDHKKLSELFKKQEEMNVYLEEKVKERTSELDKSMRQLQKATEEKSSFYARMSHELRTPLNAILGFSQIILFNFAKNEKSLSKEKLKDYIECIHSSGKSLLGLIDEVHDISKLDLDKVHISKAPFSLKNLMNNLCNYYLIECQKKTFFLLRYQK